jgi:3-hydroxyisobutyrate dehydrogenase-like beta-hydroxyacid dehydrogenase
LIGLGEVGEVFARGLQASPSAAVTIASRPSPRSLEAADRLELPLETDLRHAVKDADLVLITAPASSLDEIVEVIAGHVRPDAMIADLTAATPAQAAGAARLSGNPETFVDVSIMGAVSMQGNRTPLLASGPLASAFAGRMSGFGFNARAMPNSLAGQASGVKLMRSIFAKGMEALMLEAALAGEAMGLSEELLLQMDNFDTMPMREHLAMYLRTHPRHAARRLVEMEAAQGQLLASGLPSFTTNAALERYRRTLALVERTGQPEAEAGPVLQWLLDAERQEAGGTTRRRSQAAHD